MKNYLAMLHTEYGNEIPYSFTAGSDKEAYETALKGSETFPFVYGEFSLYHIAELKHGHELFNVGVIANAK